MKGLETKYCKRCDRTLPITEFYHDEKSKDKNAFYCRDCCREYAINYRKNNKNNPDAIYKTFKWNAKNFGKDITITRQQFKEWYNKQSHKCAYCDISEEDVVKLTDSYNSLNERLTIDCVDNYAGYIKENLVLACRRCNNMKSDLLNFEQMRYIGQNFLKPIWEKQLDKKII